MNIFFFKVFYLLPLKGAVNVVAAAPRITFRPQEPRLALLRSYLSLNCSFDIEGRADRVRVNWLKNKSQSPGCHGFDRFSSGLSNVTANPETRGPVTQRTGRTWSSLTLRDITADDSGWYFCEVVVEIPSYRQNCSAGTEVIVPPSLRSSTSTRTTAKHPTAPSPTSLPHHVHWWVWLTVGVGSLILAAILIGGVTILYRRWICQNKAEIPIYENMHPICKKAGHPQPPPRTRLNSYNPPSSMGPRTPKIL